MKPVAVWELDVEDKVVTTREGLVGGELRTASQTFASAKEAAAHAEALVAQWRKDGFVAINRIAAVA